MIRGSRFECTQGCRAANDPVPSTQQASPPPQCPIVLCETCARNQVHASSHLSKLQKNCILADAITVEQAKQICSCWRSRTTKLDGEQLYPLRKRDRRYHDQNCILLQLATKHCKARYDELVRLKQLHKTEGTDPRKNHSKSTPVGSLSSVQESGEISLPKNPARLVTSNHSSSSNLGSRASPLSKRFSSVRKSLSRPISKWRRSSVLSEKLSEERTTSSLPQRRQSLPLSSDTGVTSSLKRLGLKPAAQIVLKDIPFGNVHMGLMIGPLIIENGVPESAISRLDLSGFIKL